jgi:hypothetical protein
LTWEEFEKEQPEMAAFGLDRFKFQVMYLATVKPDSYPRIHPFTPFVSAGRLFAYMEPSSPKGKDLQRNGRYAMHSLVTDMDGSNGEFQISGDAQLVTDAELMQLAAASCPYRPRDRYVLFEFRIGTCLTNYYTDGRPHPKRWRLR